LTYRDAIVRDFQLVECSVLKCTLVPLHVLYARSMMARQFLRRQSSYEGLKLGWHGLGKYSNHHMAFISRYLASATAPLYILKRLFLLQLSTVLHAKTGPLNRLETLDGQLQPQQINFLFKVYTEHTYAVLQRQGSSHRLQQCERLNICRLLGRYGFWFPTLGRRRK
jgi:hypothetical protein